MLMTYMQSLDKHIIYFGLFLSVILIAMLIFSIKISVGIARTVSQLLIFVIMYTALILPSYVLAIFFYIISILMLIEIFSTIRCYNQTIQLNILKIISYCLLPFISLLYITKLSYLLIAVVSYFLLSVICSVTSRSIPDGITKIVVALLSLIAIASIGLFSYFSTYSDGKQLGLYIFFLTNICDVGALLGGRMWGKRKLMNSISPNKTMAGYISSLCVGMVLGCIFSLALHIQFSLLQALTVGLLIGFFTQIGDIFGSLFKRYVNIKDYGCLIPGHGGIIDRLDSLI